MAPPVLVKKYGNRRLYDTGDSRYITLDELAAKIRAGSDVRIVDAQTNEDLTQATLTQLVLETGQAAKFLPVQLLTQMIRLSDDALAEFFSRYVTGALEVYLQAKRGVQTLSGFNPLAQLGIPGPDALARMWMSGMGGFGGGYPQGYGAPQGYPAARASRSHPGRPAPAARRPCTAAGGLRGHGLDAPRARRAQADVARQHGPEKARRRQAPEKELASSPPRRGAIPNPLGSPRRLGGLATNPRPTFAAMQ